MRPADSTRAFGVAAGAASTALISLVVYVGSIRGGYVWDDWGLMDGSAIGGGSLKGCFTGAFLSHYYRPLVSLSFYMDRWLWPDSPAASHWVNIVAHAACAMAVFGMALTAFGRLSVALAAGLLFAVHPAHVGATAWIGGRTDALGALWTALFAWGLIVAVRSRGDRRTLALAGSVLAYALAVFTKEQSLALLPLVPLAFACFAGTTRPDDEAGAVSRPSRANPSMLRPELPGTGWYALGPYVVVTALFLAMGIYLGMPKPPGLWVPLSEHLSRAAETVAAYAALLLLPNQTLMHLFSLDRIMELRPWPMALGIGIALALPAVYVRLWRTDRAALWFITFVVLALVPVSGLLPMPFILFAPYRSSVAVIGLCVPLARWLLSLRASLWGMSHLPAVAALCAVAGWYTAQTIRGIETWHSDESLFTAMVAYDPGALVGHFMLARTAVDEGRDRDAARHLECMLDRLYGSGTARTWDWRNPNLAVEGLRRDWRVYARVMQNRGAVGDAEDYLTLLFVHLGYSRIGMGGAAANTADGAFETALRWRPADPDANRGLGWIYLQAGRYSDAERHLRASLAAAPDNADTMRLLTQALQGQGQSAPNW